MASAVKDFVFVGAQLLWHIACAIQAPTVGPVCLSIMRFVCVVSAFAVCLVGYALVGADGVSYDVTIRSHLSRGCEAKNEILILCF